MRARRGGLAAILLIFILTAWRFAAIPTTYMREDEEIAFRTTSRDLAYTVWYQAEQDIQAPLWFALFWAWQQVAGSTEFAGRVFSILIGMLTLALIYRLGMAWFGSARAGWLAMLAFGVSVYAFVHVMEIRPYSLILLCAALSMLVFWHWLRRRTWRAALLYGLTLALMAYVHYFLAFLVSAQIGYLLLFERTGKRVVQVAGAGALAFILWLPWLPAFVNQLATLRRLAAEAGALYGVGLGTTSTAVTTDMATVHSLMQFATNGQPLLYALLLLAGGVLLHRCAGYRLALLWALGVPGVALALNLVAAVYTERYVSYLTPGLALAVGGALATDWAGRVPASRLLKAGRCWLVPIAFVALNLWGFASGLPVRVPYRDLYQAMSENAQPGDVVYFDRAGEDDHLVRWHARAYLSPNFQVIENGDLTAAQHARRIWYLTADWFNPAVRATFDQLEPTHPVQRVLGQCDRAWCYLAQWMVAPPQPEPLVFGGVLPFYGADIEVNRDWIYTRLWWRVDAPPLLDYSFSLRLLNEDGTPVIHRDGPIEHYGQTVVQTSQMQPGQIYIDHRALSNRLSRMGTYRLELIVYQSWDGVRLPLPDGADALLLETIINS